MATEISETSESKNVRRNEKQAEKTQGSKLSSDERSAPCDSQASRARFHSFLKSVMDKKKQDIEAGLRKDDSEYLDKKFQESVEKYNIE